MKKFFFVYFFTCFSLIFGQKISMNGFTKIDSSNIDSFVTYLGKELKTKYKEKEKALYYDNLFRISLVNGDLDSSLTELDSVRSVYMKSNPIAAKAVGTQFEVYMKTAKRVGQGKNFNAIYEEEFRKKYNALPFRSQIQLPQYFSYGSAFLTKGIYDIIAKNGKKDSIEIADALQILRKYNIRTVAEKSFDLGAALIRKIEKEEFTIYDSIKITAKDGGVLSLSVILNNKNKKPENTILVNTIYSDKDNINDAKEFAINGYVGVILNTRGKYLSTNDIEPFEHDGSDINDAIDWIIKQPWSNGNIGMVGGSYLGFSQWAASKKLHPALKTIVPQAPVGVGTMDFPMNNNVFAPYSLRWLNYVMNSKMTDYTDYNDTKKWNSIYKKWYQSGLPFKKLDSISGKPNPIFQRWLTHPAYDQYWRNMTPDSKEFSKINIPVLTITGYYDSDQLGALYYLKKHYQYNKKADHYLVIGPYDHSGAQGFVKSELKGYKIDPVANIDINKLSMDWFDYILKGKQKPLLLKNKINYQVMGTNQWKAANSIEDFNENKLKLYLQNNVNTLSLSDIKTKDKSFSSLTVDLKDRTDADLLLEQKNDIVNKTIYTKNNLVFSTSAFGAPFELSGNFSGTITFSINKKDVDIAANLYELTSDGKYFLLSTYLGRASYNKDNEERHLLVPGKKEKLVISNNEFVSKKIEKGSKLVLLLGVSKTPYWEVNYGTGKQVSDESVNDAKDPVEIKFYNDSFIEIPITQK